MNNEKDNLGVDNINELPKMGTVTSDDSNVVNKFNLPPVSSFTNFDNSTSQQTVISDENNSSIINLMDNFENLNQNSSIENQPLNNVYQVNTSPQTNSIANNHSDDNFNSLETNTNIFNQSIADNSNNIFKENLDNSQIPTQSINNGIINNSQRIIPNTSQSNVNQENISNIITPLPDNNSDILSNPSVENVSNQFTNQTKIDDFFNSNVNQSINNDNNMAMFGKNVDINSPIVNISSISDNNVNVNNLPDEDQLNNNLNSNKLNQTMGNNVILDNLNSTNIVDNGVANQNSQSDSKQEETVDQIIANDLNNKENQETVLKNEIVNNTNEPIEKNNKPKKNQKKSKMLLIIILSVSLLIIIVSLILSYFMFFKSDNLICEYQDYSNDDFLLSEVINIKFKGRQMANAKFTETLNFTESGLSKKDSYETDLRNQFDGLGFDVKYEQIAEGFQLTMDLTKENLENWTGNEIKSATKDNLLREMKNSGYTCK